MKKKIIAGICTVLFMICALPSNVFAADAAVIFGSDSYENESGAEFPVGVYIDGDSEIGYYKVEIEYDHDRLRYIEGASSEEEGKIIFEGVGNDTRVSTMLRFEALSGGETQLKISDARVLVADSDNEAFEITEKAIVPIKLNGEDVVANRETTEATESPAAEETTEATTEATTEQKKEDGKKFTESEFFWPLIMIIVLGAVLIAILISLGALKSRRKKALKQDVRKNVKEKTDTSDRVIKSDKVKKDIVEADKKEKVNDAGLGSLVAAVKTDISKKSENTPAKQDKSDKPSKQDDRSKPDKENPGNIIDKKDGAIRLGKPVVHLEQPLLPQPVSVSEETNAAVCETGEPVIQVKNVSMIFKVSNSNTSGLKDYAIQKVKGKIKKHTLKALDNISFDIYKGEVVGIIGTNGSGKSTLLKIVSGALRPTSGEVIADNSKIQLLTLGTGFDSELSARENVYLNGAIIGYSKEFIDKHYDEIVEFAELQDFMEEKVKNFSSGMVSRLGFSIATVAGAAEILILDEVLAVGDQFFRKKSLARVKEMIHGGSTVLIVSHSLATIKSNCTKVIWIEKGVLKMVGTPQKVCDAYSRSHENEKKV